jgi:hypothetical protein
MNKFSLVSRSNINGNFSNFDLIDLNKIHEARHSPEVRNFIYGNTNKLKII